MFESDNPFLTGSALEALSEWSNALKTFQSRIGQYFARSEARQRVKALAQALASEQWQRLSCGYGTRMRTNL